MTEKILADKAEKTERKAPKSLYFEGRVVISPLQSEAKMFAALAAISQCGFRHEVIPGAVAGHSPRTTMEEAKNAVLELAKELQAGDHKIASYTISEVWVDSGSFDSLKLLEEPPHADKH